MPAAIKADAGDLGVIPGSMGTRSYIVRGKGSAASWNSCSPTSDPTYGHVTTWPSRSPTYCAAR